MHGDISRHLFDPANGYSSVREQQGRVQLDADRNENTDILIHDDRQGRVDLIGHQGTGAPLHDAGMAVSATESELQIGAGRYYVGGIRCDLRPESGSVVAFNAQPFLPASELPTAHGYYLAYLDVWERPVSSVQDPHSREVALGGPDTSTRSQVVWQVKLLPVSDSASAAGPHGSYPEWDRLVGGSTGTLQVRVASPVLDSGPCVVPEAAGFRGVENQLYRFQIHRGNFDPTQPNGRSPDAIPTFKWSRDNGSVVAVWRGHPSTLRVDIDRVGPGGTAGFDVGTWIELTDDHDDLLERPGLIARVADRNATSLTLESVFDAAADDASPPDRTHDVARHSQVRRWDCDGVRTTAIEDSERGGPVVTSDGWIRIEDGIEVRFGEGSVRSTDFWIVPARTALLPGADDIQVDWPFEGPGMNNPVALRPHGPQHHYARLALVHHDGSGWSVLGDARNLFPALGDMVQLSMRGGDGQHGRSGHWLPAPLQVGVSRGGSPVSGVRVHFAMTSTAGGSSGRLSSVTPSADGATPTGTTEVETATDNDGIATVWWRLGNADPSVPRGDRFHPAAAQCVEATLLAPTGAQSHLRTRFWATAQDNLHLQCIGGDAQSGRPGETLELALRVRVMDGTHAMPGAHVLFACLSRYADGQQLDSYGGGAVHASANVVSRTQWPDGSGRTMEAVVRTDDKGVAQAQWVLGTDPRLAVQRMSATLLDATGERTSQQHLFSAQVLAATEIGWDPCEHLESLLKERNIQHPSVQVGMDVLCEQLNNLRQQLEWLVGYVTGVDVHGGPVLVDTGLIAELARTTARWGDNDDTSSTPIRRNDVVNANAMRRLVVDLPPALVPSNDVDLDSVISVTVTLPGDRPGRTRTETVTGRIVSTTANASRGGTVSAVWEPTEDGHAVLDAIGASTTSAELRVKPASRSGQPSATSGTGAAWTMPFIVAGRLGRS